jgi:ferrous-iron efflux pump FieF
MAINGQAGAAAVAHSGGERAARLMRRATYAAVATATLLIVAKFAAYVVTGSVSVLSTLLDSLLDVAASLINLIAVRTALLPADREHRFGHGKAEPLAGLGQSTFIAGSALFLLFEVGSRLIHPQPVENSAVGIAVMVISIVVTLLLVLYQRRVIRETGSMAISADSLHYFSDVLVNGAVIGALLLSSQLGWRFADPLFGGGIAIYILFTAWQIARGAYDMLMDRELPDAERAEIRSIALANPAVRAVHDLRTRGAGHKTFVQLHLEMDATMSLLTAHRVADEVEAAIIGAFPGAEVIIHQDPEGIDETRPSYG